MTATTTAVPASVPPPTVAAYLRGTLLTAGIVQAVLFLIAAGLAASRAEGHVLSAAAVGAIAAVAAASSAGFAWVAGIYGAAVDAERLGIEVPATDAPDPLAAARLWRNAGVWAIGAAAWAAAGAGLVAVALDGRVARFPVLLAALVGLAGVATLAVGNAARRVGLASGGRRAAAPTPLRERAWKHIALPVGILQALVNAGFAWVLFHSYATGSGAGVERLTDRVAVADAVVVVVLLTVIFSGAGAWGGHDAATGRVTLDDPLTQSLDRAPHLGVQGIVYTGIVALALFRIAGILLPPTPSLLAVIVTRGVLAGVIVGVTTGVSYVRGACNRGVAA